MLLDIVRVSHLRLCLCDVHTSYVGWLCFVVALGQGWPTFYIPCVNFLT